MTAKEVLSKIGCELEFLATREKGEHALMLMYLGRLLPKTRQQALKFKKAINIDVLGKPDVIKIEKILNNHGFTGDYSITKSKYWARLKNIEDLKKALLKEYPK